MAGPDEAGERALGHGDGAGLAGGHLRVGSRVRITQQVPHLGNGDETLTTAVEGVLLGVAQAKTGSWYAHSKDHKLWLDRVQLRKADGEIVFVNLDQYSVVEGVG